MDTSLYYTLQSKIHEITNNYKDTYKRDKNFSKNFMTFSVENYLTESEKDVLKIFDSQLKHNKGINHTIFIIKNSNFENFCKFI